MNEDHLPIRLSSSLQTNDHLVTLIRDIVADFVRMDPNEVDPAASFAQYGLGSVEGALILGELEDRLNLRLSSELLYDCSTIAELAVALNSKDSSHGVA